MHDTAYDHGRLFFELYNAASFRTIVELGSQDVNGTLRDHCPFSACYIGLDVAPAKGVDVVIDPNRPLPIASDSVDAVVTSSAFEHDPCFWETFLELIRILRPGGLLYVNVPSNAAFHRFPVDCWRFYPDAGVALVQWAARRGLSVELMESFVAWPQTDIWVDFVAVFRKMGGTTPDRIGRIADRTKALNIYDTGMPLGSSLEAESRLMPDMQIQANLKTELQDCQTRLDAVTHSAMTQIADAAAPRAALHDATAQVGDLQAALAAATEQLAAMRASRSWRLTAGLRRIAAYIRAASKESPTP
jgi:SAM-dependent methyltransferase